MTTAEQNYLLLQEIEANRRFLLMAYQQNPQLLERAEARIRELIEMPAHSADNNLSPVPCPLSSERGVSLIELIMFIVIISVAVTGILRVMNQVTGHSADPLIRKQTLAIAESLLEEVELMPFTYCDPNDASAVTAASTTGCAGGAAASQDLDGIAQLTTPNTPIPAGELRGNANPFDNVADYGGYAMNGITDITGNLIAGLGGYTARVDIARAGNALLGTVDNGTALRITVTAAGPGNTSVVLDGYRTRYAPNDLP